MTDKLSSKSYDLVVVGAGIVGLAHACLAARSGLKVCVVERDAQAVGASIRNFGFITVTGQQRGEFYAMARRTAGVWRELSARFGFDVLHQGLFMCARRPESEAVLDAFLRTEMGEGCRIMTPAEAGLPLTPDVRAVLHSPHDLRVESRDVLPKLAGVLAEVFSVDFFFDTQVLAVEEGHVATQRGRLDGRRIVVCPGDTLTGLYQDILQKHGVKRCKLQMLRLENPGFRLPGGVMSDLGLLRYLGYAELPEAEPLRQVVAAEQAQHLREGVHLIVVQSQDGSLVVGDSHDYDNPAAPFSYEAVDRLILDEYAHVLGEAPAIRERWTGTYAVAPDRQFLIETPAPNVRLVVVTCGAGASTAFALAEKTLTDLGVETHAHSH
ncbi:TIGR03364 family FAD-dependent oxidoreductase [Asticcacaulis solisilvae]|uniref:TIGR03364 family FAD-dependent oxidoreductase n=1 Tax=Asticcacaulis solisilvae TaxID=1217274 RepID=UPI003FD6C7E0